MLDSQSPNTSFCTYDTRASPSRSLIRRTPIERLGTNDCFLSIGLQKELVISQKHHTQERRRGTTFNTWNCHSDIAFDISSADRGKQIVHRSTAHFPETGLANSGISSILFCFPAPIFELHDTPYRHQASHISTPRAAPRWPSLQELSTSCWAT